MPKYIHVFGNIIYVLKVIKRHILSKMLSFLKFFLKLNILFDNCKEYPKENKNIKTIKSLNDFQKILFIISIEIKLK